SRPGAGRPVDWRPRSRPSPRPTPTSKAPPATPATPWNAWASPSAEPTAAASRYDVRRAGSHAGRTRPLRRTPRDAYTTAPRNEVRSTREVRGRRVGTATGAGGRAWPGGFWGRKNDRPVRGDGPIVGAASEGGGLLEDGRLPVGGLVGVDDALAGGLVEQAAGHAGVL